MPRRKTLRAGTKRAAPKAPPGKAGEDLTGESRKEKLEVLLKDFDAEVEMRRKEMAASYSQLQRDIEKLYHMEIMKMPKSVQNMKYVDFIAMGGCVNVKQIEESHKDVEDLINSIKERPARKGKTTGRAMETISEDGQNMEPPKTRQRAPKTATKTAASRKKGAAGLLTPMNARNQPSTWDTPLQTPAIDPRLPQTPAVRATGRKLRPGEGILIYSVNGSPIQLGDAPMVFAHNNKDNRVESICTLAEDDKKRLDKSILHTLPRVNIL